MHGIMRMSISKEFPEHRRYTPTSMAKAKLVDKEYPKLGQKVSKRSVFLSTSPHGS